MTSETWLRLLLLTLSIVAILFLLIIVFFLSKILLRSWTRKKNSLAPLSYHTNIIKDTQENKNFRRVLFTGLGSQLVIMNIPPDGEIGEETHKYVEQTLFLLSGTGEAILNGKKTSFVPGDVIVVPPGIKHNLINMWTGDLKIYTVYSPPNHIDGRIHQTKDDADDDDADEAVGKIKPICTRSIFEQLFGL